MTLRTIKRLITGLAGLAVLFAGVSLITVPKAHALYCGGKTLPPGNWYATNTRCGPTICQPRGTWFVQESSPQGFKEGFCLAPAVPPQVEPANDVR